MVPTKPKRPCSYPGCPKLTDGRFCEEHAKAEAKRYEKYDRDPAVRRRYGRAWKRIRDRYIQEHPLCELCQRDGRLTPAEEVHHKVPLSEGGTHARDNLVALCKSCHARIHAQRGDRWHRKNGDHPEGSSPIWRSGQDSNLLWALVKVSHISPAESTVTTRPLRARRIPPCYTRLPSRVPPLNFQ